MSVSGVADHVVIVGGGVAGTTCAETVVAHAKLRSISLRVTLLSADSSVCVGRALVSSARAQEVHVHCIEGKDWANDDEIRFVKATAIGLDTTKQMVKLADGSEIMYSALCIASGAAPMIPSSLAKAGDRAHVLRDINSFRRLEEAVASATNVVVVGNGGVALETVYALKQVHVNWIFRDAHPGAAFFDRRSVDAVLFGKAKKINPNRKTKPSRSRAADVITAIANSNCSEAVLGASHGPFWQDLGYLQGALRTEGTLRRRAGVEVVDVSKKELNGSTERLEVVLSTGEKLSCDLIVCGTGVAPCVDWLGGSGIDMMSGPSGAQGISVHGGSCRSSVHNVFAAGDCATVLTNTNDEYRAIGADWFQRYLWTQARAAGTATGRSIVAHLSSTEDDTGMEFELFTHATRFFDVPVVFLGRYAAQGLREGYKMLEEGNSDNFVRVVLLDGRVRGALLVGEAAVERSETYENLILDSLIVEHLGSTLVDLDVDIEDYFD